MTTVLQNVKLLNEQGELVVSSIVIEDGKIASIGGDIPADAQIIDGKGHFASPGFVDVHTHLREPGFEHKETIATGTASAAKVVSQRFVRCQIQSQYQIQLKTCS